MRERGRGRGIGIREIEREREEKSLTLWTQKFINRQILQGLQKSDFDENKIKIIAVLHFYSTIKCNKIQK